MNKALLFLALIAVAAGVVLLTTANPAASRALADGHTATHTAAQARARTQAYDAAYSHAYDNVHETAQVTPASPAHTSAVCTTDANCARWDEQHFTLYAPQYDKHGNAKCPRGQVLFDTENPDEGDMGIVCVKLKKA